MAFMLCDHIWATIVPGNQWLTFIGRLAFPIFAFQVAEGARKTHDLKKMLQRMLLFAAISEIPFNLMMSASIIDPFEQNVMFTFAIALAVIYVLEKIKRSNGNPDTVKRNYIIASVVATAIGFAVGMIGFVDYLGFGVLTVLMFYFTNGKRFAPVIQLISMFVLNASFMAGQIIELNVFRLSFEWPVQAFAVFSLIFIWMYNGKHGKHSKPIQIAYYLFYPAHMAILFIIANLIR